MKTKYKFIISFILFLLLSFITINSCYKYEVIANYRYKNEAVSFEVYRDEYIKEITISNDREVFDFYNLKVSSNIFTYIYLFIFIGSLFLFLRYLIIYINEKGDFYKQLWWREY